jgi:hypothetical protein
MTEARTLLRRQPPAPAEVPPLITWIDPPTQRYYVFCAFVGYWSVKLGRLLLPPRPTPLGTWWWYILDITYCLIVRYLRIPWLRPNLVKTVLFILLLSIVNYSIVHPTWVSIQYMKNTRLHFMN